MSIIVLMSESLEDWKTQEEACAILGGVSAKTVERMVSAGRLHKSLRRRPGKRPEPVYHPGDLERIRFEESQPKPVQPAESTALTRRPGMDDVMALAAKAGASAGAAVVQRITPDRKLFLSVDEASEYSGLTQAFLRRKIRAGELTALKDAGWKIRRADLDKL